MKATSLGPAQLARLAGVSTDTLRHYEREGLLVASRRSNGYREYPTGALGRVRLVQHALSAGFTIEELARILKERDHGGTPCREVRALAASKLERLAHEIEGLMALRDEMRALLKEWDDRLAKAAEGKRARLLESWTQVPTARGEATAHRERYGLSGRKGRTK